MSYNARFNKNGNIKVGQMWTFNKLAGNVEIAGCMGTCGTYCQGCFDPYDIYNGSTCYVFKAYLRYGKEDSTVVKSHVRNTNAMRNDFTGASNDLRLQILRAKKKPEFIRIHSSGELESVKELVLWESLAREFSDITFYLYTKNFDVLERYIKLINPNKVPNNFFINVSVWHEYGIDIYNKYKHFHFIRAFVYVDVKAENKFNYAKHGLKIDIMCPAYKLNKKGKVILNHDTPCNKCKICMIADTKVCGCLEH